MQAIILCGGLSTRLGGITKTIPKILLDIRGRTVLEWQIELLKQAGIDEVILASGHLHDTLVNAVGARCNGVSIQYAKEERRLDTGGAIKHAMQYICTSPFFVLNGDVLLEDFALSTMLNCYQRESEGILLGVLVEDTSTYGEIASDDRDRITGFREKPRIQRSGFINAGVYLFNKSMANYFPIKMCFLSKKMSFRTYKIFMCSKPPSVGLTLAIHNVLLMPASILVHKPSN